MHPNYEAVRGKGGIYKIVHLATGRAYIGSAKDFARRWQQHYGALMANRHKAKHLQSAWNKYGNDAFHFDVIEFVGDIALLINREQYYLDQRFAEKGSKEFNTSPIAGSQLGYRHSPETRVKLRQASRHLPSWNKGKEIWSEEDREIMRQRQRGKTPTDNQMRGLAIGWSLPYSENRFRGVREFAKQKRAQHMEKINAALAQILPTQQPMYLRDIELKVVELTCIDLGTIKRTLVRMYNEGLLGDNIIRYVDKTQRPLTEKQIAANTARRNRPLTEPNARRHAEHIERLTRALAQILPILTPTTLRDIELRVAELEGVRTDYFHRTLVRMHGQGLLGENVIRYVDRKKRALTEKMRQALADPRRGAKISEGRRRRKLQEKADQPSLFPDE